MTPPDFSKPGSGKSNDDSWSAYEPTQIAPTPGPSPAPNPAPETPYYDQPADPYYAAPAPMPAPAPYPAPAPAPFPYAPSYGPVAAPGPAPATGQVSSIVAIVIGGLFAVTCYGLPVGLAPLILGILGLTKSNASGNYWRTGQAELAVQTAESSKKMAMWAWIAFAIGFVIAVIVVVAIIIWAVYYADSTSSSGYST
ncbi:MULTISPECIES: hypothetical protein [unclassified Gordonia (in: high G+C Gram-positive bacteria)]|uniref:hypothetical protein n=1 Tax=unclassified Gordonia (in: high G+C Gram-positive bacteria) TaxID=2657482 RepID=UPI001FFEBB00|nr:hypothetical protein [Gordonia sp. PP30]UQE77182.1 hypothetical protein MYK68_03535 [Gordonia sp. PP30]